MNGRGLRLPKTLSIGAGEEHKRSVMQHWNTADEVAEDLAAKGFKDLTEPPFPQPELNLDTILGTDSRDYTGAHLQLLAWYNYTSELYGKIQIKVLQYENMLDILSAQTRKQAKEQIDTTRELTGDKKEKATASTLQDKLLTNPEYQEVLRDLQRYKQAKILMEKKVDILERSLRVVSRQVEIRKLDIEQSRNNHNMPGRSRPHFAAGY